MIVGHQKQWEFLRKSARVLRVPHALLFSGEEQIGKKKVAIEFIKLLNCENKDFNVRPCQNCRSCQAIQKRIHPDFIIIEPQKSLSGKGSRTMIQISQIRKLNWQISLKPFEAHFKSAIIDSAHLMNQEAQNSLLKTLEEPKGTSFLILISECPERLLPTVRSRVQQIKFYPVKQAEVKDFVKHSREFRAEARRLSEKDIQEIVRLSEGKPGRVIDFLQNPQELEDYKKGILELLEIIDSDLAFCFQYAKLWAGNPDTLRATLDIWLRYFRGLLLARVSPCFAAGKSGGQNYSLAKLKKIIEVLQRIDFLLFSTNINPKLALEFLMVELKI